MRIHQITTVGALALMLGLTACKTQENTVSYFQDIDQKTLYTNSQAQLEQRIAVGNDLIIRVSNVDPQAVAAFNLAPAGFVNVSQINTQEASPYIQTYLVDKEGEINFPVFGRIHVAGMTARELSAEMERRIGEYAPGSIVQVMIDAYTVTLLGEVNAPGNYQYIKDRTTLLDLIATGGDLTIYGDRRNVLLIRETPEGTTYQRFDLTKAETLSDSAFYLQQHDVVYVEPILTRRKTTNYDTMKQYNLSIVSTVVSMVSVIASLAIALLIK
jgi:polysaccharide export outer membrane protein